MNALLLIAEAITALALGPVVLPYAIATQNQAELCAAMKGTYDPAAPDQCKDGRWIALIPIIRDAVPAPKK